MSMTGSRMHLYDLTEWLMDECSSGKCAEGQL